MIINTILRGGNNTFFHKFAPLRINNEKEILIFKKANDYEKRNKENEHDADSVGIARSECDEL